MPGFHAGSTRIWPVPPDWTNDVRETLAWSTDIGTASATAATVHRALRDTPARVIEFEVLAGQQEHRVADMLIAGYGGRWALPFWPDVQWLSAVAEAGDLTILCATVGFDFVVDGFALLFAAVNQWEMVRIAEIQLSGLTFDAPLQATYRPGARLYPLRTARLKPGADLQLGTAESGRRHLSFEIDEPCDWPGLDAGAAYLGHPVLDRRPDESDDPTSRLDRLERAVDYGVSQAYVYDPAGVGLRAQQSQWLLAGRAEHSWFRSLLYTLQGRRVPLWLPSFAADLRVLAPVGGASSTLSIEWAGYTQFGLGQPNRRDVRIELRDRTVFYRRITAAAEGGQSESLLLDAPLDVASIAPDAIRSVSFMALATLASDEVEIEHVHDQDGFARATTGWQAVLPDV